jgi:hypothetical protein
MSLETMTKLFTTTVGAGGSSSLVFSNIPQGYTDLLIKISCRTSRAADEDGLGVQLNDTTTGYTYRVLAGDGAAVTSVATAYGELWRARIQGAAAGTSIFSNTDLYFPNYSGNQPKAITSESVTEKNGTNGYMTLTTVLQPNPSPITSITLSGLNAPFQQFSTFTIYGIKNARQTAGNSIKATGGNIVFDGTYVYHVFPSTSAFVPNQPLFTDLLVVGGGAGGGGGRAGNHYGAGGGAGAAFTLTSQYLTLGSYPVTVGAGGAGGSNSASYSQGTNGTSSQFSSSTVATGGGGGGSGNTVGLAGASGGGGGGFLNTSPAGGAGNQGFAGGAGAAAYRAGGGGGAGGVGANGNPSGGSGGAGGIGLTSALVNALCSATGIGQNVSGTWYVAGGGAGTPEPSSGGFGGGGGGGLGASGSAGIISSGGGGGGGTATAPFETGGTGGSGVVIIRYKG